jgi:DNA-directed RNA polymerase sigma subunit (sigma70/sigma32)
VWRLTSASARRASPWCCASRLEGRERAVLRARFGLDGPAQTLRTIARGLGISAERVRQIEHHALEELRAAAGVS